MASGDLYLRSLADKSGDILRLRSDDDKVGVAPPYPNQFNKIPYTSEPPTPNAWNQVKQEAGTGWKKLLYS
jgi:hypothetical protein